MENAVDFLARKSAKKIRKLVFFVKLNISWIELLVAKRHLYNGQNNHICRCGKQKNEFDIYVVTIMCLKAAYSVTMNIFRKFLFSF